MVRLPASVSALCSVVLDLTLHVLYRLREPLGDHRDLLPRSVFVLVRCCRSAAER